MMISTEFYLAVKKVAGWKLGARISSRQQDLAAGEIAMKLTIQVPEALFSRPLLQASITVPEALVGRPVVDATVLDNVRDIIAQQTGLDITVKLIEPEENG